MALVLNGTSQYAFRPKSAVDYYTSLFSMFAYVNRNDVDSLMSAFGVDRESGYRHSTTVIHRFLSPDNRFQFEIHTGTPEYTDLADWPATQWVPVLFEKVYLSTPEEFKIYIGNSTAITAGATGYYTPLDVATHQVPVSGGYYYFRTGRTSWISDSGVQI